MASQAPIVRLAARLVRKAFELSASDIHLEAEEADMRVRYRVDGVLVESERLPKSVQLALTTRIKIQAGLNIAERRLPQDGRMQAPDRGQRSTSASRPCRRRTARAWSCASSTARAGSRISPRSASTRRRSRDRRDDEPAERPRPRHRPDRLGQDHDALRGAPPDQRPHLKVVTVEDPVEYRMAGVNQVQAHPGIGLDFAAALRSILRQDPDVVMVGEIRDGETARIAVQAALTGHLVISTLHTNSAPATVTRLMDMGIEPYLIAATLNGVVAQRLVRRLCGACAEAIPASPQERLRLGVPADAPLSLKRARGCPACNGTGYRGRMVASEIMTLDGELRGLIATRADEQTLTDRARKAGMTTLADSARARVLDGDTTLDEVGRVLEGTL